MRKPPCAATFPKQPAFTSIEFHSIRPGVHLVKAMLEQGAGDVACILHRRGDVFAGDGAHAARRWQNVFRRDRLAACRKVRDNALAVLPEMQHVIEGVRADVHQAIPAVVTFAAAVNIAEFADFTSLKGARNRLH